MVHACSGMFMLHSASSFQVMPCYAQMSQITKEIPGNCKSSKWSALKKAQAEVELSLCCGGQCVIVSHWGGGLYLFVGNPGGKRVITLYNKIHT